MTHVVVFAGGRGATTILTSLARTRNVQLTVVVNAYDAGALHRQGTTSDSGPPRTE